MPVDLICYMVYGLAHSCLALNQILQLSNCFSKDQIEKSAWSTKHKKTHNNTLWVSGFQLFLAQDGGSLAL